MERGRVGRIKRERESDKWREGEREGKEREEE